MHQSGMDHDPGSDDFHSVGAVEAGKGSKLPGYDTIQGADGGKGPPFSDGTFTWSIPWEYRVGSGSPKQFTIVNHVKTIDASGKLSISKGGHTESKGLSEADSVY